MKKYALFLLFVVIAAVVMPTAAYADIFDSLAKRADTIGSGLRDSGYIIAGIGLAFFSFAAIFGKVNWKTLAYIMMCVFILSVMAAVISWVRSGEPPVKLDNNTSTNAGSSTTVPPTNSGAETPR